MWFSESPYQGTSAPTPFQKVIADINNGCQCACHLGIGTNAACSHCMHLYTTYYSSKALFECNHCWHNVTALSRDNQHREKCCWCGEYRTIEDPKPEHGRFR